MKISWLKLKKQELKIFSIQKLSFIETFFRCFELITVSTYFSQSSIVEVNDQRNSFVFIENLSRIGCNKLSCFKFTILLYSTNIQIWDYFNFYWGLINNLIFLYDSNHNMSEKSSIKFWLNADNPWWPIPNAYDYFNFFAS